MDRSIFQLGGSHGKTFPLALLAKKLIDGPPGILKWQVRGQKPRTVSVSAPTLAVRAPSVDFKGPGTRGHGRIADRGGPQSGLGTNWRWSAGDSGGSSEL